MDKIISGLIAFLGILALIVIIGLIIAYPTKWLWNWLMPVIFNLPKIGADQALGLIILSGLLFSSKSSSSSKEKK